eukprot:CAMPEP_0118665722 /NCGR_PEP_ID=MMETSP0785-20121206/18788_1 /TAXON_ID=91992 /ORGANISM="Bolidomonas pacifica, Strain CCMP 1866" /LENGTH=52 /DNA_ID=CAMNT_0006559895 /DNA_START=156 /DNA_END=310 /DNA_ORIENTATION=+
MSLRLTNWSLRLMVTKSQPAPIGQGGWEEFLTTTSPVLTAAPTLALSTPLFV